MEYIDIGLRIKKIMKRINFYNINNFLLIVACVAAMVKVGIWFGICAFAMVKITQIVDLFFRTMDDADQNDIKEQKENLVYEEGFSEGYLAGVKEKVQVVIAPTKSSLQTGGGTYN